MENYFECDAIDLAAHIAARRYRCGGNAHRHHRPRRTPQPGAPCHHRHRPRNRRAPRHGNRLRRPFIRRANLTQRPRGKASDFPSSSGARLYADTKHTTDSSIYTRIRAAGLVPFGRTTTPEFGLSPVTEAGFYGAPTRNPWHPDHTPGGSSGGAGAGGGGGDCSHRPWQ